MATTNTTSGFSEPIELLSDDDDDEVTVIEDVTAKKPKRSKIPTECLNVQCKTGEKFIEGVPAFVLIYYKVRKKKGLKICEECFNEACAYYACLKEKLFKKESICDTPCTPYSSVLNIDSEEEDLSPDDDEEQFDLETFNTIEEELSDVIRNVATKCNVSYQLNDAYKKLSSSTAASMEVANECDATLDNFQREIDEIRNLMYNSFQPHFVTEAPVDIDDRVVAKKNPDIPVPIPKKPAPIESTGNTARKSVSGKNIVPSNLSNHTKENVLNESKDSQDVVAVSEEVMVPPSNLPPAGGSVVKPALKPGDIIFAMKHSYKYAWKKGVIVNIFNNKGYNEYQLKIDVTNPRKPNPSKILQGKFLAYPTPATFRFAVGVRVIAGFKEENVSNPRLQYYSGVIAEPPKVMNKFRYLVFFDDGCAQYVPHEHIRLICESSENAWDDVPADSKAFIKNYLQKYPERPMVKLQIGNMVKVESESNWYHARVKEIDASLARMCYLHNQRTEWIYRGSTRLGPLFREMEAAKHRMQTGDRVRKIGGKYMNNLPYVEYTRNAGCEDEEPRAVARKSTASNREHDKVEKPKKWQPKPIPGKVEFKKLVTSMAPKKFIAHQCCTSCIEWTNYNLDKMTGIGPLAVPLHFGFRRLINTFSSSKHNVIYRAPCGRQLRNMEEVHLYLRITKSQMTVDLFDFDYWVRCQAEFVIHKAIIDFPDISQRKEKCPIAVVNYFNGDYPEFCGYMTERKPKEGVVLNLDPNFLCGCDCTDDCQDKEKCSCWQLTIEGQKLIPNNVMDPNVGYSYRRLTERVITGIYECNAQCKCSKRTCLNRVVQHPLSQKLQLFKTEMKGWGIRCINDIPQGAFICVYAGHLLTEQQANEEGKNYGDEYLAELDYIEVIERIKEDYESDVPEELLEESDRETDTKRYKQQLPAKNTSAHKTHSPDSSSDDEAETEPRNYGDIRSRLRERKKPAPPPPEAKPKEKKKERFSIRKYYGDDEDDVFIMDAKSSGNIGRYLNHSCMPNVFVQNVFVDTHDLRFPWVAFFALTHITAGSELTWDYNYDIGSVEGKIKYCYCGSQQCRGRLL